MLTPAGVAARCHGLMDHSSGGRVSTAFQRLLLLLLALSGAGCAADTGSSAADEAVPAGESLAVDVADDTVSAADTAAAEGDTWTVSVDGVGDLRIGMELDGLMPHLEQDTDTIGVRGGCRYVSVTGAPDSVLFMVESGRLARIDVRGGTTPTAEGAQIGDEERRIETLYPDLRRMPHKYTDGNYLIVIPAATDTLRRYVFETDGERVTQYRAGVYPQVEWVEGCA